MVQKSDDYEQMESNVYKPYVLEQVKMDLQRLGFCQDYW